MNALILRSYRLAALVALGLGSIVTGCGHPTLNVSALNAPPALGPTPTAIPGIPFYVKHGMCKRETVWAQPENTLQLEILQSGKPIATRSITFSQSFLRNSDLKALVGNLNLLAAAPKDSDPGKLCQTVGEVTNQWMDVAEAAVKKAQQPSCDVAPNPCEPLSDAVKSGDFLLLSNTANIVAEVDYEHPYYINSRTPWIGNSQVDAKLSADGTLTEGSAQTTDQTWSTILSTVGSLAGNFATVASAAVTANRNLLREESAARCTPSSGWPVPSTDVVYRMTTSTDIYLHDHVAEDASNSASCKPIDGGVTGGNVTISKQDTPAKADPNVIKVSGQITLPKADATTPK